MAWMLCLVLILAPTPRDAAKPKWGEPGYTFTMFHGWVPFKAIILRIREYDGNIEIGYAGDKDYNVHSVVTWEELRNLTK